MPISGVHATSSLNSHTAALQALKIKLYYDRSYNHQGLASISLYLSRLLAKILNTVTAILRQVPNICSLFQPLEQVNLQPPSMTFLAMPEKYFNRYSLSTVFTKVFYLVMELNC